MSRRNEGVGYSAGNGRAAGTGSAELVASILLFTPWTQVIGAALALAIMTGAIVSHFFSLLGIDHYGDGGVLFKEACAVWLWSLAVLVTRRREVVALIETCLPFLPVPARLRRI